MSTNVTKDAAFATDPSPVVFAELRARQYWFEDGLPSLVGGVGCSLGALAFACYGNRNSTPATMAIFAVGLVLSGAVWLSQFPLIEWLKSKISYSRTGYTRARSFEDQFYEPLELPSIFTPAPDAATERLRSYPIRRLVPMVAVVGLGLAVTSYIQSRWVCALLGSALAFAIWFRGRKVQRASLTILTSVPYIGFLFALLRDRSAGSDRTVYFIAAPGILFTLDGTVTLIRYLRANPRPHQTEP